MTLWLDVEELWLDVEELVLAAEHREWPRLRKISGEFCSFAVLATQFL